MRASVLEGESCGAHVRTRVSTRVRLCEGVRKRLHVSAFVGACVQMRACVCARVRVIMCMCVRVCARVYLRECACDGAHVHVCA